MSPVPTPHNPRDTVIAAILAAVRAGVDPLRRETPLSLPEWMSRHFYRSAESSYGEGRWESWPTQIGVLYVLGSADITYVYMRKSARHGATKMLLGGTLYYAEQYRRNQVIYQPTDGDRDKWVKTELDTTIRDCPSIERIFPGYIRKAKTNTLEQKFFLGCMLYMLGATSAGNFRRISVDGVRIDEISKCPRDVEGEGSPHKLGSKRVEGSAFPSVWVFSTPTIENQCQISELVESCPVRLVYHVPCPSCGELHPLEWGSTRDERPDRGLVWEGDDPSTVGHLCPHCGTIHREQEIIGRTGTWHRGRWRDPSSGVWLSNADGQFRNDADEVIDPPAKVAFDELWTAYSPQATWTGIVSEWIEAASLYGKGRPENLITFTNTTLGRPWRGDVEKTSADDLRNRAEDYPLRIVPRDAVRLLAWSDVQGDRWETFVVAEGADQEFWLVEYGIDPGNPMVEADWSRLLKYEKRQYPHALGGTLQIEKHAIDTGFATHETYRFIRKHDRNRKRWIGTKGETRDARPIFSKRSLVDVRMSNGKIIKNGVAVHFVGTDTAKDTLHGRLQMTTPGPGYIHLSKQLPAAFFSQVCAEERGWVRSGGQWVQKWTKASSSTRNEALDGLVGVIFLADAFPMSAAEYKRRLSEVRQPSLFEPEQDEPADHSEDALGMVEPDHVEETRPMVPAAPPPVARPADRVGLGRSGFNFGR